MEDTLRLSNNKTRQSRLWPLKLASSPECPKGFQKRQVTRRKQHELALVRAFAFSAIKLFQIRISTGEIMMDKTPKEIHTLT